MEQLTQQPTFDLQLNGLTLRKLPSFIWHASNLTPPAPSHTPQLIAPMSNNSVLLAIMIYILLVQQSSNTGPAAQHINPPATWHWSNPQLHLAQVVKSQEYAPKGQWPSSSNYGIQPGTLLLTRMWKIVSGFGLPTTKWTNNCYPLPLHRTPSQLMAHVFTVNQQIPQFSNPLCYHRIPFKWQTIRP